MPVNADGWQLEQTPWTVLAACQGSDPELWFPTKGGDTTAAKAVCAACPVQAECLDYSLRWSRRDGIWGGLTVRERRALHRIDTSRRRVPAPHGTTTRYGRGCRCGDCREANRAAKCRGLR